MEERAYDEGVMKKAGEILADERLKAFDEMNGEEKAFSHRFEKKKEKLFRRAAGTGPRGRVTGRRALRITAVCAAAVILMTVSVMATPPVREAFDGFRTRIVAEFVGENRMTMTVESDGGAFVIVGSEPTYIPEGYELTKDIQDKNVRYMYYTYSGTDREKEHFGILFERVTIDQEDFTAGMKYTGVDQDLEQEPVRIGNNEGILIHIHVHDKTSGEVSAEVSRLIWSDSRYYYELEATTAVSEKSELIPLPYEKLLRMAESVSRDAVSAADESVLFGFIPEEEGEPVTEGICPRCGKAEIEAVCSHQTVLNSAGEPVIDEIPVEIDAEGTDTVTMRREELCYTDHVCPGCGYRVSGGRDDCHTEWILDDTGEKIPVCPYREEE